MNQISRFCGWVSVLALVPASGCIVVADGAWSWGWPRTVWTEPVTETIAIDASSLQALSVKTHNGSITCEAATGDSFVTLTKKGGGRTFEEATAALEALEVFVEPTVGAAQRIGWRWRGGKRPGWRQHVSYEIHAPAAVAFEAETHNGGVRVSGLTGDVEVETHNGGVAVESSGGRLYARTHNGGVVADYGGGNVTLITHNGPVRADLRRCGRIDGKITTHNGGVRVVVGQTLTARVTAETHNGSIRCRVPLQESEIHRHKLSGSIGTGEGRLAVRTHNGSVQLNDG